MSRKRVLATDAPGLLRLGESGSEDPAWVGGKAAALSRAIGWRIAPIPEGFCIPPAAAEDHEAIALGYQELCEATGEPNIAVAVRSSGLDEDGLDAAFAGIHETVLDVRGVDSVLEAVSHCFASASAERAMAYRRSRGLSDEATIAVLVQQMVEADASAIVFSADPMGSGEVVIAARRGAGEALSSGDEDAQEYRTDGTARILPGSSATASVLSEADISKVATVALELEHVAGGPVDVELARCDGRWHLIQYRPITAGFPFRWQDPKHALLTWYRDDVHFPVALTALSTDYFECIWRGSDRRFESYGIAKRTPSLVINGYAYMAMQYLDEPGTVERDLRDRVASEARVLRQRWEEEHLPVIREAVATLSDPSIAEMPLPDLMKLWSRLWEEVLPRVWEHHFYTTGPAYRALLDLAEVVSSLNLDISEAEAMHLIDGTDNLLQALDTDLEALAAATGSESEGALAAFLAKHGHLGQPHDDLTLPSWLERPDLLEQEISRRKRSRGQRVKRQALRKQQAQERTEQIRRDLAGRPDDLQRFEEALAVARDAGPLAEDHNYEIDRRIQAATRLMALRVGERLVGEGSLQEAADVLHLHQDEVAGALAGRELSGLVPERIAQARRREPMAAPSILGKRPPTTDARSPDDPLHLKGIAASIGRARGPVRIVRTVGDLEKIQPGDVLVSHAANPSWVPVFGIISAFVSDVGHLLAHAAVTAREMGIPAVVGVRDATERLTDGTLVEVDGEAGVVSVPAT